MCPTKFMEVGGAYSAERSLERAVTMLEITSHPLAGPRL